MIKTQKQINYHQQYYKSISESCVTYVPQCEFLIITKLNFQSALRHRLQTKQNLTFLEHSSGTMYLLSAAI